MLRSQLRNALRLCFGGERWSPISYLRFLYKESKTLTLTSSGISPSVSIAPAEADLNTIAKAESVLGILKGHGLTETHIAIIASKLPVLFNNHPEKYVTPKLEFFLGTGFPRHSLAKLISKDPLVLTCSLKSLTSHYNMLRTVLGSDSAAAAAISRSSWIFRSSLEKRIFPNIKTLSDHGVSGKNIARHFKRLPRAITASPGRFSKSASLVKKMGFDPSKSSFVQAVFVHSALTPATWNRKMELYRSLGWSQEVIISAFKVSPLCMLNSEEKVRKVVGFLVKNLNWDPLKIASQSNLLTYDFEKRILPRYAVYSILARSGLAGTKSSFSTLLRISESLFLKRYVFKYRYRLPELLEALTIAS